MLNVHFTFQPRAAAAVRQERGLSAEAASVVISFAIEQVLPVPITGDYFSDPRVSRHLFVVVRRTLLNDRNAVELLLDLTVGHEMPPRLTTAPRTA